jgi:hypothetical protein
LAPRFAAVDLAIALAPRALDMQIVAATRAPRRIGYTYARRYLTRIVARRWLTEVLVSEADPERADRDPSVVIRHEVDQVLALARAAGATRDRARSRRTVSTENDRRVRSPACRPDPIVIHIGKRWGERGSTPESLAAALSRDAALGRPLVATYGDDGRELAGRSLQRASPTGGATCRFPFGPRFSSAPRASSRSTPGPPMSRAAVKTPTVVLFEHRAISGSTRKNGRRIACRTPSCANPRARSGTPLRASRAEIVEAVATLL